MNDTEKYKGKIIDERDIDLASLMTYMGFINPEELHAVKQAKDNLYCDIETIRWAVNWWHNTWGGVPKETLEYLGVGNEE